MYIAIKIIASCTGTTRASRSNRSQISAAHLNVADTTRKRCARIHTDVEKHHGFDSPIAKAQQPRPQQGSGFFISSPVAGDTVSFLVDRVGHSQECAGSFARSVNPHGLPPSFDSEGAGLEPVAKEPLMANSVHTGITSYSGTLSSIYGVDPAELHAGACNALQRALRELHSDDTDYKSALQKAEAAVAVLWSLANAQGGVQ
jgi:hypothetical protein